MALTKVTFSMIKDAAVNVIDLGADNTGSTDSSAAFAAAIATGKPVYVPEGTYKVSFDFADGTILYGDSVQTTILVPPADVSYVIRVDARTTQKVYCQIANLTINNAGSVANCVGILFEGTDVTSINDSHVLTNVIVKRFENNIQVNGRMIGAVFNQVRFEVATGAGLRVYGDATDYAFNLNTFNNCTFKGNAYEGVKITGYACNAVTFYACDFEGNNSGNLAGYSGVYIENLEQTSFIGCYFEGNGSSVVVDTGNYLNNSFGLRLTGSRCFDANIQDCWMVDSGILVLLDCTSGLRGGSMTNNRITALSTGWAVYNTARYPDYSYPNFTIDANNTISGVIEIVPNVDENVPGNIKQIESCTFIGTAIAINLATAKKLLVTGSFNLSSVQNMNAGMELWIANVGSGTITVDAALMASGSAYTLAAGASKILLVGSYPKSKKFIPIG